MMQTVYYVAYAEPQTFGHGDQGGVISAMPASEREHTSRADAERELAKLSARLGQPLRVRRLTSGEGWQ
ncbi:hypothetical protein [Crenobacter cavernae]|uniref:Uncharacterized protein n=1 Tax=Crenobacter cavernae TaxID=2290923 RepID=A0A345Y9T6_9NEIS|nr:hypothetical protein [Crenobacter cavernae]AXK40688.1 hypothetical protein DWG20_15355 [Crenobacter cavernae]